MKRISIVATVMVSLFPGCDPGPASELRSTLPGTWTVIESSGGWLGDTIHVQPGDWIIGFGPDGSLEEFYRDEPLRTGSYGVERREDIGFRREALMLDLTGEKLEMAWDQPFEVAIEGDTMVLTSGDDDGHHYRLIRFRQH